LNPLQSEGNLIEREKGGTVAKLLKPNGTITEIDPRNGSFFSKEELSELTDRENLELIPLPNSLQLVVGSSVKVADLNNRAINRLATLLTREIAIKGPFDFVRGKAVVLEAGEIKQ